MFTMYVTTQTQEEGMIKHRRLQVELDFEHLARVRERMPAAAHHAAGADAVNADVLQC